MMHGWRWSGWMGIGIGGGTTPLLIVTALIIGGYWVIRAIYRDRDDDDGHGDIPDNDDAQEILRQRYARGEVSRDDYLSMKEDLK